MIVSADESNRAAYLIPASLIIKAVSAKVPDLDSQMVFAGVNEIKHALSEELRLRKITSKRLTVMISGTVSDLTEHRTEIMDACMRQGMLPKMMGHLPANDAEAISASIRILDEANIYIGVFAHRYGYVPKANNPQQVSVTELEYNRAVERKIPRLIFVMDEAHQITVDDVEMSEGAVKLDALKKRLLTENTVNFFNSPADLRAKVISSLSQYREPDLTTLHYVSDIPAPPEAYIAHPYTLLQTHRLIGRQKELSLLTDWVANPQSDSYRARIMNIVATGGMGKSALTWEWFNKIAPQEMKPLAGRMWWSFYESNATFENFIIRALAYVTQRTCEDVQQILPPERETQLLAALGREPFLLVLDGLERILIAYARMDAARLTDDDLDERTANFIAIASGHSESTAQSLTGQRQLRKTVDLRVGSFLRKLAQVQAARVLVSTRLYPADLQTDTGDERPGCRAVRLPGLRSNDALELWYLLGVSGSKHKLLTMFETFDNHPLLIRSLAGEVARYRRAPGDFDQWRKANPKFDPFCLPLVQVKSHVLSYAMQGLDTDSRKVLNTLAAFRMPASYDTLASLIVGEDKPFKNECALDDKLTELEDRGLLGWDKRANRYDLHPIVRGVIWNLIDDNTRRGVYEAMQAHFEAIPTINEEDVNSLEDLTPAIELYITRIGLGRYDDACDLFNERLEKAMLYRLSLNRHRAELLEMLLPDGLDQLPNLSRTNDRAFTLNALAVAYNAAGQPGRVVPLYHRYSAIQEQVGNQKNVSVSLCSLANALRLTGALCESEIISRRALLIDREQDDHFQEAFTLRFVGLALAMQVMRGETERALLRSLRIYVAQENLQAQGVVNAILAKRALWLNDPGAARPLADRAWDLAHNERREGDFIRAARAQGAAALGLGDLVAADERLHYALVHAREVNLIEEELPALVGLAELARQHGDLATAHELLDEVWEAAERGPYPLENADALNVLVQIERDAGNSAAAAGAAMKAYRLAWCDGPPFAYCCGLEAARKHLRELGAPEPDTLPFDDIKYELIPEVNIDPEDEFHVGKIVSN